MAKEAVTLADGQLGASAADLMSGVERDDQKVSLTLCNTTSASQTVLLSVTRGSDGTARRVARAVLAENETLVVSNLPLRAGDVLKGQSTHAAVVDYVISGNGYGGLEITSLDANGALKHVATAIAGDQTVTGDFTAGGTATLGTVAVPGDLTVDGGVRLNVSTVTATGTSQASAALLSEGINVVSAADTTKGAIMPTAVTGASVIVVNAEAATLNIYPATGGAIDAETTNAAVAVGASAASIFVATSGTQWYSIPTIS